MMATRYKMYSLEQTLVFSMETCGSSESSEHAIKTTGWFQLCKLVTYLLYVSLIKLDP